jgi:hypothetical protein
MGRCRFFNSVSVFGILFGMFSKSVRFSVSVFFNTAVSVRFFGFFKFSLSIDCKPYIEYIQNGADLYTIFQTQSVIIV